MHSETHFYLVLCTQISSRIISYFAIEISFLWYYMEFFLSQYFRSMYVVCVSKNFFFFLNTGLFCKETQGMFSTEYPSWVITVRRSRDAGLRRAQALVRLPVMTSLLVLNVSDSLEIVPDAFPWLPGNA